LWFKASPLLSNIKPAGRVFVEEQPGESSFFGSEKAAAAASPIAKL
jgi:hypothetical protein